jgi:hypothetical protein
MTSRTIQGSEIPSAPRVAFAPRAAATPSRAARHEARASRSTNAPARRAARGRARALSRIRSSSAWSSVTGSVEGREESAAAEPRAVGATSAIETSPSIRVESDVSRPE